MVYVDLYIVEELVVNKGNTIMTSSEFKLKYYRSGAEIFNELAYEAQNNKDDKELRELGRKYLKAEYEFKTWLEKHHCID